MRPRREPRLRPQFSGLVLCDPGDDSKHVVALHCGREAREGRQDASAEVTPEARTEDHLSLNVRNHRDTVHLTMARVQRQPSEPRAADLRQKKAISRGGSEIVAWPSGSVQDGDPGRTYTRQGPNPDSSLRMRQAAAADDPCLPIDDEAAGRSDVRGEPSQDRPGVHRPFVELDDDNATVVPPLALNGLISEGAALLHG